MLSWPPAATISASPSWICWDAKATARSPEPQTWLMFQAALSVGRPALIWAWRAGFWPWPAVSTWPRIVSSTSDLSIPARVTNASSTAVPRSCAGVLAKAPPKLPTAVLAAEAITTLVIRGPPCLDLTRRFSVWSECNTKTPPLTATEPITFAAVRQAHPERHLCARNWDFQVMNSGGFSRVA